MSRWMTFALAGLMSLCLILPACKDKKKDSAKIQTLMTQLKSDSPDVREKAAKELGRLGPYAKPAIPLLAKALNDEEPKVGYAAARALGKTKLANARIVMGALSRALKSSDSQMRISAALAIGDMGKIGMTAYANLATMLKDDDEEEEVKKVVKKVMARIKGSF